MKDKKTEMLWVVPVVLRSARKSFYHSMKFSTTMASEMAKIMECSVKDIQDIVPKMTFDLHKGQCGRIGVIGGSKEYVF